MEMWRSLIYEKNGLVDTLQIILRNMLKNYLKSNDIYLMLTAEFLDISQIL